MFYELFSALNIDYGEAAAPPEHPGAPPEHPDAHPEHPDAPPEHPDAHPEHPDAPPEHPDAPPEHPDAPPEHPDVTDLNNKVAVDLFIKNIPGDGLDNTLRICSSFSHLKLR